MKNVLALLLYLLLLLWNGGIEAIAQQHQLDSLTILLKKNHGTEEKELQLLNAIAAVQVNINPNDALAHADKAIVLAQKLNHQHELAEAYNNKGFILMRKSEFVDAKNYLNKALKINTDLSDPNGIAHNLINTAEILRRQGETDTAKKTIERALRIYEQTNDVKGRADAYFYQAQVYKDLSDFKTMLELCNKAIAIYRQLNDDAQLAIAIDVKCGYYYFIAEYDSALEYIREAQELSMRNNNRFGLAMSYATLGHVYGELPDFPKAVDNHIKSLKIHEEMGNLQMQGNMNVNIGLDYYMLKQYKLALQYTSKGIKQMDALKISNGQYRIAVVYMGMIYLELGGSEKSLENTNRAISLCLAVNDDWALSDAYNCLGNNYLFLHRYYSAIINYKKALALKDKLGSPLSATEYYIGLSKALTFADDDELLKAKINPSKRNELILNYLQTSLKIGVETKNNTALSNTLEQLSIFYERRREMSRSLEYYRQFISYKDSITNTDNTNAVALLQIQYETEKREQQISLLTKESILQHAELQRENTTRNVFIAALALAALLAGIIYNRYRIKQKANAIIETTLQNLKRTQEQLVEHEKLASLGKFTAEVAREIEYPVKQISRLNVLNRTLIRNRRSSYSASDAESLKTNLLHIYHFGIEADAVVKKVLVETRKLNG